LAQDTERTQPRQNTTEQNRQSRGSVNSWHKIQNGHKQDKTQQNKLDKQNGRHQRNRGHCFFILLKGSYLKRIALADFLQDGESEALVEAILVIPETLIPH
jgi:hypothetical protein